MAERENHVRGAKAPQKYALNPREPLLAQPFARLVGEGYIRELRVVFTPTGVSVSGKAAQKLVDVEGSNLDTVTDFPVSVLAAVAEKGNICPPPGKGKKKTGANAPAAAKPLKSLVKSDLDGSTAAAGLQVRINNIAASCGGGPLVGRVRSAGRFSGTETTSYQAWWVAASGDARALSLSVGKHYASFTDEEKQRLNGLQCPFRGTLEFVVAEDSEDEEEATTK